VGRESTAEDTEDGVIEEDDFVLKIVDALGGKVGVLEDELVPGDTF
jgi:hypothetical protein